MNLSNNDPETSASARKRLVAKKHNEAYEEAKKNPVEKISVVDLDSLLYALHILGKKLK